MNGELTPIRPDLTAGVKSKTHRREWGVNGFNGFNGFSLEGGRGCACARAAATYLQRIGVKSVKSVKSACRLAVNISHLSACGVKPRVKSGGGASE